MSSRVLPVVLIACLFHALPAEAQKSKAAPSAPPKSVSLAEYGEDRALFPYYFDAVPPGTY